MYLPVKEQNRHTFYSLDSLITLHQRKYEMLKNIKSSLLEKMFVWRCPMPYNDELAFERT